MFENWKISSRQFKYLVILCFIGTSILRIPSGLAADAKQDAWIAALLGILMGLILVWIYTSLGSLYPNMTITQQSEKILGKKIGKVVSFLFVLFLYVNCSTIVWISANFLTTQILIETPLEVIIILWIVVVVFGTRLGLETIARAGEILFPIVIVLFIILVVSVSPNIKDLNNMKPMFESGMKPIIKGALYLLTYTTMTNIVLMMIFPANVVNVKDAKKSFFSGTIFAGLMLFIVALLSIIILGSDFSRRNAYPSYVLAKKIHIGNYIQRIEIIIALIWFITVFYKTILYFYGSIIGLTQTLGLKDYKSLTLPLGMILVVLSIVIYPSNIYLDQWDATTWLPFIFMPALVLPLLLLIIGFIRKKLKLD